MSRKTRTTSLPPPFLKRVWLPKETGGDHLDWDRYPLSLPTIQSGGFDVSFEKPVTIIVGENGSGKSTLLEAIATMAGFSDAGGAQGMRAVELSKASGEDGARLGALIRGAWLPQVRRGWFFRAETFFSVARYLDESGSRRADYLSASHGEGFLSFFEERLREQGLFILDEPESALSPAKADLGRGNDASVADAPDCAGRSISLPSSLADEPPTWRLSTKACVTKANPPSSLSPPSHERSSSSQTGSSPTTVAGPPIPLKPVDCQDRCSSSGQGYPYQSSSRT